MGRKRHTYESYAEGLVRAGGTPRSWKAGCDIVGVNGANITPNGTEKTGRSKKGSTGFGTQGCDVATNPVAMG